MSSYHIYLAVMQAHKQSQMDAAHAAEQAPLHRLRAGTPDARRSLRGRIVSRLGLYWSRDAGDPQAAEIAVTIADDWQGRGLGTELLAQLTRRARCGTWAPNLPAAAPAPWSTRSHWRRARAQPCQ